jgi:hypothetical protein
MVAGQGFKDFVVGEVLTSSDVDGFLMQQSVMRFADDGARGSALGTAVGTAVPLAEGMVAYLDDVNYVQVYNGSAWTSAIPGIGSNVVQTVKTDTFSTTSGTAVDVTNLSATITPTSDTSKILVIASLAISSDASAAPARAFIVRDATTIYVGDTDGTAIRASMGLAAGSGTSPGNRNIFPSAAVFFDSPATASPVTYKIQMLIDGTNVAYLNRNARVGTETTDTRVPSSLTLIEVAA